MKGLIKPLRPFRQFKSRVDESLKLNDDPEKRASSKVCMAPNYYYIHEILTLQWDQLLYEMAPGF